VALVGVPSSGAYLAKELLLQAAADTQQWWWAVVLQAGGIFTSSYLVLVLVHAFAPADEPVTPLIRVPRSQEAAALALSLCSLSLGLVHWDPYLAVPDGTVTKSNPFALVAVSKALWPVLAGVVLAVLLGRWELPPPRAGFEKVVVATFDPVGRVALASADVIVRIDAVLREWPAAALSLLAVSILFGVAMLGRP
jgi:NADH:ubiquinone oxidoreductase subunit 5 (subunit L)/multisubunit Na+/H+ antiporter MnhA subunit